MRETTGTYFKIKNGLGSMYYAEHTFTKGKVYKGYKSQWGTEVYTNDMRISISTTNFIQYYLKNVVGGELL